MLGVLFTTKIGTRIHCYTGSNVQQRLGWSDRDNQASDCHHRTSWSSPDKALGLCGLAILMKIKLLPLSCLHLAGSHSNCRGSKSMQGSTPKTWGLFLLLFFFFLVAEMHINLQVFDSCF